MPYERKTTLVAIYKDTHATLKMISTMTSVPMTKLLDEILVEQFRDFLDAGVVGEAVEKFLKSRQAASAEAPEEAITET